MHVLGRVRGGDRVAAARSGAASGIPQPRGRPPKGADGEPCSWDADAGQWMEADGGMYDRMANGASKRKRRSREGLSEE